MIEKRLRVAEMSDLSGVVIRGIVDDLPPEDEVTEDEIAGIVLAWSNHVPREESRNVRGAKTKG